MPDRNTLAKIHIAKKDLGLDDTQYGDVLRANSQGKESAALLTDFEAEQVLDHFRQLGWKPRRRKQKKQGMALRFQGLAGRPGMASPAQLRKIEATWMTHPNIEQKNEVALRRFLQRRFQVSGLRFIEDHQVGKILKAIENIRSPSPQPSPARGEGDMEAQA
ncbi:regulatory protein GemA [Nitrospina gracilis]|uniref:regulatory protein GemA n=1 Tax=Nitrospina gracilis TaxID=35801 RepID=UPI001F35EBC2|nr:regulatory protein GemA [Nitrospina gracilis]MCF8719233.1 hypothetical protein [Nitrospina gracilis Nb-211]